MNTATLIKNLPAYNGDANLYKLDPPMEYEVFDDDEGDYGDYVTKKTDYVIVSAVIAPFSGAETYIFAADKDGKVVYWSELEGSLYDELDHEKALNNAGYEVES